MEKRESLSGEWLLLINMGPEVGSEKRGTRANVFSYWIPFPRLGMNHICRIIDLRQGRGIWYSSCIGGVGCLSQNLQFGLDSFQ